MSSPYPVLGNRPIDQWKVTELKEELKRRKLTTKGLKDDLIKRLDEAIRIDNEDAQENADSSPEHISEPEIVPEIVPEIERGELDDSLKSEEVKDFGENINEKIDGNEKKVDVNESEELLNDGKLTKEEPGYDTAEPEGSLTNQAVTVGTTVISETKVESVVQFNGQELQKDEIQEISGDSKTQMESDASKSPTADAKLGSSDSPKQVLEFHVKSDSLPTDPVSINEKNEIKDNIIADDVNLALDVKPEMVQPSSIDVSDGGISHPMDVEEPNDGKLSVVEKAGNNNDNDNVDIEKKISIEESSSPEKLSLDRTSGDDSMEEDTLEGRKLEPKSSSDKLEKGDEKVEPFEEVGGNGASDDLPANSEVANVEDETGTANQSVKRKVQDEEAVVNIESTKRQRRWNSESLKVPGPPSGTIASPKDAFQPTLRRSFSRTETTVTEEVPKERTVPPSSKPSTNSLRIDNFLRPFTLKAVQELLGRTGTVTGFWMDHIKTHCYVSFSSVEEAVETRNAVYNLQWPPNGGRLLVAEFVDPQEVKMRLEGPPQSPATPVGTTPALSAAPPLVQPQPQRQQIQRQQLPPPSSLPPPPPLSNPPSSREVAAVKERLTLPPPPPLPEKVDPPLMTLDDLFRRTRATPRIYYLPLSDEQVEAKLKTLGNNTKQ